MSQPAQQSVVQPDDVNHWVGRVKTLVDKPETLTGPGPAGAQPWHNRTLGCFDPIDTCLLTCCCPCVTFGRTHHRLNKDASMQGYSAVNASCLLWCGAGMFGLHWIMQMMQRREIRDRYTLDGDCAMDCVRVCCLGCCDLIQQDKEAQYQLLQNPNPTVIHEPTKQADMAYAPPPAAPVEAHTAPPV